MIGISTVVFDLEGADTYGAASISELDNRIKRRVTTTPTLDGGSFISDQGYSPSDKLLTFKIANLPKDRVDKLIYIAKNHSRLFVTTSEGAYYGVIKQVQYFSGKVNISIIIEGLA